ncbi:MAG TPA: hypothetical protein VFQ00_11830 [Terriglobales bacterium]|nr:hypothetical protein [Terriglobales bacterium]
MGLSLLPFENEPLKNETISPEQFLNRAFAMFSQAADSLEGCYRELESEVQRLRGELRARNQDLQDSVARNQQMRRCLERIFQILPYGIIVIRNDGLCQSMNAEAQRILGGGAQNVRVSNMIGAILAEIGATSADAERTITLTHRSKLTYLGIRRLLLAHADGLESDTVLLIRELTS